MKIFLFATFLGLFSAESSVFLPNNMIVKWSFPSDEEVLWKFYLPPSAFESYDWAGLGLKPSTEGTSMTGADNVLLHLPSLTIEDAYSTGNSEPLVDSETEDCEEDLTQLETTVNDQGYTVFSWTRALTSESEPCDRSLTIGEEYYLQWALGSYNADGSLAAHSPTDCGSVAFTLKDLWLDMGSFGDSSFLSLTN